jgi:hypothetical protein
MPPPFPPSYFSASFLPASFILPNFTRTHHTHTPPHLEFCVPQLPRNCFPPPSIISLLFHPDAPNFPCLCFLCVSVPTLLIAIIHAAHIYIYIDIYIYYNVYTLYT